MWEGEGGGGERWGRGGEVILVKLESNFSLVETMKAEEWKKCFPVTHKMKRKNKKTAEILHLG